MTIEALYYYNRFSDLDFQWKKGHFFTKKHQKNTKKHKKGS